MRESQRRALQARRQLRLENEDAYYDIHGVFPEGSTRTNPVAPEDQFYRGFTDSAAQNYNRAARTFMDDRIEGAIAHLSAEDRALINGVIDEGLLYEATGRQLKKRNKKGFAELGEKDVPIDSTKDEALEIDLNNAELFAERANTVDPRTLDDEGRAALMLAENTRAAIPMDNPMVQQVLAAADRNLNQIAWSQLGNAATGGKGRERARDKSKLESREDGKQLLAQEVFGTSTRTGAQTAGRGTDIEHIIAANVLPKYNNEAGNKYPGPKYLNRAYGDTVGAAQDLRVQNHIEELQMHKAIMENPDLVQQIVVDEPRLFPEYGKKAGTILKGANARYNKKFDRFNVSETGPGDVNVVIDY